MAENQTVDKPAVPAAPPELDVDSLLETIPALKNVFEEPPKEEPKEGAAVKEPEAPETAKEVEIPEGLKPAEEEKPEEPKKEEKETSERVQKRIDELTAKRKTAEERAASLETELTELKAKFVAPPPVAPTPANPFADIDNVQDLEVKAAAIQQAKDWALEHWDGGDVEDGKNGKQWLDGAAVRAVYRKAENMLSKHVPEHRVYLANKVRYDSEAKHQYPAIFKEGSEANKVYKQWLTVFPECRRYPDIALIIGDALVGQQIRLNRAKPKSNGKSPSEIQPLAAPAPAASPRVPQKALSGEALSAAFQSNPDAALSSFVDSLIDDAASRRNR